MPFGDRTGPAGTGPMTGRGAGYCGGNAFPGNVTSPRGGGFWGGRGGGRGWRNRFYATGLTGWQRGAVGPAWPSWRGATGPQYEQEASSLKEQAKYFESALENIRKRIDQLETKANKE